MNTRITIDLQDPHLMTMLRLNAAKQGVAMRDIIKDALESYFSNHQENVNILKSAEQAFQEWDNPKDAAYDKL